MSMTNNVSGDPEALRSLARQLLAQGIRRDPLQARRLLEAASARGDPEAMLSLASLNAAGIGGPQDWARAVDLVGRAAANGHPLAQAQLAVLRDGSGNIDLGAWFAPSPVTQHCDAPRIYTVKRFLPPEACTWLVQRAQPSLQPTLVKDPDRGRVTSEVRTSTGAQFSPASSDLVFQLVSARIAAAVGVARDFHEHLYILNYARGQEYKPHFDFIAPEAQTMFANELHHCGQRIATVLVYLNDDYEGGETSFPRLKWKFKGETGDALVFWNLSPKGDLEIASLHAGLPVEGGEKWLLSQWIRERPFGLI